MTITKVYVCCPKGIVTGGPELLHQFVHSLRIKGIDAYILYYPFDEKCVTPIPYQHYNIEIGQYENIEDDSLIILPEVATSLSRYFRCQKKAIWWLSVDNYFPPPCKDKFIVKVKHLVNVLQRKKVAISRMQNYLHLCQSEYAMRYLAERGYKPFFMPDYLNYEHLTIEADGQERKKQIVYNPKKGVTFTNKLIGKLPQYKFLPLVNMTASDVRKTLQESMLYIDFGHHPGKDRLPREAAMAGCCVITGRRGSAANEMDIPIPNKYKINEFEQDFMNKSIAIITSVMEDFPGVEKDFIDYRQSILKEKEIFEKQVNSFIELLYIKK